MERMYSRRGDRLPRHRLPMDDLVSLPKRRSRSQMHTGVMCLPGVQRDAIWATAPEIGCFLHRLRSRWGIRFTKAGETSELLADPVAPRHEDTRRYRSSYAGGDSCVAVRDREVVAAGSLGLVAAEGGGDGYGVAESREPPRRCNAVTRILDRGSGVLAFLFSRMPPASLPHPLPCLLAHDLSVAWQLAAIAHRYGREAAACGVACFSLITRYVALPCLLALLCFACVLARTLAWLEEILIFSFWFQ